KIGARARCDVAVAEQLCERGSRRDGIVWSVQYDRRQVEVDRLEERGDVCQLDCSGLERQPQGIDAAVQIGADVLTCARRIRVRKPRADVPGSWAGGTSAGERRLPGHTGL